MMRKISNSLAHTAFVALFLAACSQSAFAQQATTAEPSAETDAPPATSAPYDDKLMRLAEVLGSIHYLRNLCGSGEGSKWRDHMSDIITAEEPPKERRARLIARFNRGFRAFDQTYSSCTQSALLAARRYQNEGVRLSSQITSRYGR